MFVTDWGLVWEPKFVRAIQDWALDEVASFWSLITCFKTWEMVETERHKCSVSSFYAILVIVGSRQFPWK